MHRVRPRVVVSKRELERESGRTQCVIMQAEERLSETQISIYLAIPFSLAEPVVTTIRLVEKKTPKNRLLGLLRLPLEQVSPYSLDTLLKIVANHQSMHDTIQRHPLDYPESHNSSLQLPAPRQRMRLDPHKYAPMEHRTFAYRRRQ